VSGPLIQIGAARPRLPEWARRSRTHFESLNRLKSGFRALRLHTVCESARCPNIHECFHRGAATFMILGNVCTRGCGFCAVPKGRGEPLDPAEPASVARMAAAMNLRYVVLTSVNRDDLEDGGSRHFAETIRQVRLALPDARVEALTPDFNGDLDAVSRVLHAGPHVFNHNMETVPRLYRRVRPQAGYRQSLSVLAFAAQCMVGQAVPPATLPTKSGLMVGQALSPANFLTKSGFMVGLGETEDRRCASCFATCAAPEPMWPPSASTSSPRAAICPLPPTSNRASSTRIAITGSRSASRWCSAGPWSAAPTWRTR
jgi:lipoic acid synthetase